MDTALIMRMFLRTPWIVLALLLGVAVIVVFRYFCNFPTELDRVGSDLSLYGYGVGLTFLFGTQLGRPVLRWLQPPERVTLVVCLSILLTLLFYCINMFLSKQIRQLDRRKYRDGLESLDHLTAVLSDRQGRRFFAWSLICGLFPTLLLVAMDLME